MEVVKADVEQQEAIAQLLKATFDLPVAQLSPDFLHWKFFLPRPGSTGSRSYLLCENAKIHAHVSEWPISFFSPSGEVAACHLIDWLSTHESRGAGVTIFQHLMQKHGTILAIGGSPQARMLLPKLGFQCFGTFEVFALVVRPVLQYRSRPGSKGARALVHMARNIAWSLPGLWVSESEWTATPVASAKELPSGAFRVRSETFCLTSRTAEGLQYLADCPLMDCGMYSLRKADVPRGYFLLNQVGGQCRIIDLSVDSEKPTDWEGAYRAATITARKRKQTCEIVAVSSLPWLSQALGRIGFKLRKQTPVFLYDPAGKLFGGLPLHLRLTDSDDCLLYEERYPFLT